MSGVAAARRAQLVAVALAYAVAGGCALATGWALSGRHPVLVAALADLAATLVVFAFSVRHDNSSLYDPYWSVAPVPVVAWWIATAAAPGGSPLRQGLVALLVAAWAVRLTANCLLRWRSLADEDFRYRELRARSGRAYWPVSLLGIHLMPTFWVFLGLLPLYPALTRGGRPPGALDGLAALVTGGAIVLEGLADLELRRFLRGRADPSAVLERGAWAWSRHPNYLGEVLFWWGLWLFGLAAAPDAWWTAAGPIAITLLFVLVSVPWMDRRMLAGHPAWADRMARVPALFPWPRRRGH